MASQIFQNILKSEIENFKKSFSDTSTDLFYDSRTGKLIHPGEFGMYKERVVKKFLQMIIPQRLSIHTGFVITPKNNVSTQCDIVIYDSKSTPLIQDIANQTFYPVETVVGLGEIKSTLSKNDLKIAINKLAKNKRLRSDILDLGPAINKRHEPGNIDLEKYPFDHIFSFIICEKFNFDIKDLKFAEIYDDDIDQKYKHNLILSVKDGLFFYNDGIKNCHYPIGIHHSRVIKESADLPRPSRENFHFEIFAHYFFMGLDSATIYYPDIINYLI